MVVTPNKSQKRGNLPLNPAPYFLVIRGGSLKKIAKKNRPIMQAKIKV
jgi:hypothetical protein